MCHLSSDGPLDQRQGNDATRRRKMLRNLWKNKPQAINIWDSYDSYDSSKPKQSHRNHLENLSGIVFEESDSWIQPFWQKVLESMAVADIKPLLVALALSIADHVLLPLLEGKFLWYVVVNLGAVLRTFETRSCAVVHLGRRDPPGSKSLEKAQQSLQGVFHVKLPTEPRFKAKRVVPCLVPC